MKPVRILLALGFLFLMAAVGHSDLGLMSVQVKEGQLRSAPSFLGPIVGPVVYGERVEALQQQGEWVNVKNQKNQAGWIHQSALTKKQVALGAGAQGVASGNTSQEIALAGKGFNADVESQYRKSHKSADYAWVDRMEMMRVTQNEMVTFLKDGAVKPPEGGVK
jgi:SH3-like domain-containing protein